MAASACPPGIVRGGPNAVKVGMTNGAGKGRFFIIMTGLAGFHYRKVLPCGITGIIESLVAGCALLRFCKVLFMRELCVKMERFRRDYIVLV